MYSQWDLNHMYLLLLIPFHFTLHFKKNWRVLQNSREQEIIQEMAVNRIFTSKKLNLIQLRNNYCKIIWRKKIYLSNSSGK